MKHEAVVNGVAFEIETFGMGTATGKYPGEFTPTVKERIEELLRRSSSSGGGKTLHLFSGESRLGDVRVDLTSGTATHNMDVFDFLSLPIADRWWDAVLLDPPYELSPSKIKNLAYAGWRPLAPSVPLRNKFADWCREHAAHIIWLDVCAPVPSGFRRLYLGTILPGGYHRARLLSWLKNNSRTP